MAGPKFSHTLSLLVLVILQLLLLAGTGPQFSGVVTANPVPLSSIVHHGDASAQQPQPSAALEHDVHARAAAATVSPASVTSYTEAKGDGSVGPASVGTSKTAGTVRACGIHAICAHL